MTATIAAPAPEPNPSLSSPVPLFDWETTRRILADRRPDWKLLGWKSTDEAAR